jgi:hypothetical protein
LSRISGVDIRMPRIRIHPSLEGTTPSSPKEASLQPSSGQHVQPKTDLGRRSSCRRFSRRAHVKG